MEKVIVDDVNRVVEENSSTVKVTVVELVVVVKKVRVVVNVIVAENDWVDVANVVNSIKPV